HLDLRAAREVRAVAVSDADGVVHNAVEPAHHRPLETIFGTVTITRLAYRAKGTENLHLQDAALNLPRERHSHGLRELCAIEAARGSYEEAQKAIERATGVGLGKRQVEGLARRAALDVDAFYEAIEREPVEPTDALVISADGKGIVMRPNALRPATQRAAQAAKHKLKTRLSKGEKRNAKRMAELAVVYDCAPVPRTPADVFRPGDDGPKPPSPVARAKWLTGSVVEDARDVISDAFTEAERRDPGHDRQWVALVDGAKHQIDAIKSEAKRRGVEIAIVVDFVHVVEYLWGAAWCFFDEGDPAAEAYVAEKGLAVLEGKAGLVAGAIRRKATALGLATPRRKKADDCARYLKNKAPFLDYPKALERGWPIATGVIEGSIRYIVRDRFDITGARWSLDGAEAMLKLRAVRANGDWVCYWRHHLAQERKRVHESRYANRVIPAAA
ncbi:MAG: ISKra4 family transposase, partial [Sphingopyxis sp.]